MKISIYQINCNRDKNNMMYMSHDKLQKYQGSPNVDSQIYDKIYSKEVDCKNLENVFQMLNTERPSDFKGHSLSVSDIIEVVESENVAPGFYFCDSFGFKKVYFEVDKTQVSGGINEPIEKINVLLVEPKKYARMIQIENTLEAKQKIVGGYIQQFMPYTDDVAIICNEEGKMLNLPLNRAIYTEPEEVEMPYTELKSRFRQAEKAHKSIEGYVVFT